MEAGTRIAHACVSRGNPREDGRGCAWPGSQGWLSGMGRWWEGTGEPPKPSCLGPGGRGCGWCLECGWVVLVWAVAQASWGAGWRAGRVALFLQSPQLAPGCAAPRVGTLTASPRLAGVALCGYHLAANPRKSFNCSGKVLGCWQPVVGGGERVSEAWRTGRTRPTEKQLERSPCSCPQQSPCPSLRPCPALPCLSPHRHL